MAIPGTIAVIAILLTVSTTSFLTASNVLNVLQQVSMVGIITMGMTLLLISGNFDLSVGGQVALLGVLAATLVNSVGTMGGVMLTMVGGAILGATNGLVVTRLKVNSLVATLGSGLAFGGIAYLVSGSAPIVLDDPDLADAVQARIIGIPLPVLAFVGVILVTTWMLHITVFGRQLYAVGKNPTAATYAGVRVPRIQFIPFVVTGVYCAIAAVILTGLLRSASPNAATSWPLDVIAAAVVGGVSIAGGKGTVGNAVSGVLLIGIVGNGFNLLNLDPNLQPVFTGVIIILAVALDGRAQSRSGRWHLRRRRSAEVPSSE